MLRVERRVGRKLHLTPGTSSQASERHWHLPRTPQGCVSAEKDRPAYPNLEDTAGLAPIGTYLEVLRTRQGALRRVVGKYFLRRDSENWGRGRKSCEGLLTPSPHLLVAWIPSATSHQVGHVMLEDPVALPPPGYLSLGAKQGCLTGAGLCLAESFPLLGLIRKVQFFYRIAFVEETFDLTSM